MPENVMTSSARNFEKMGRTQTRPRGHTTPPQIRKTLTHRERQIKNEIDLDNLALRIGMMAIEHYEGWFEYDAPLRLALDLDARSIIRHDYVRDRTVRIASILNAIEMLVREGRYMRDVESKGEKFVTKLWLTNDEFSVCQRELNKRLDKRELKRREAEAREEQLRESGKPIPINRGRRKRERQRLEEIRSKKGKAGKRQSTRRTA